MLVQNENDYFYGMKRYFDIGCQPIGQKGLCSPELVIEINKQYNPNIKFLDVVRYENELSIEDIEKYELKPLIDFKMVTINKDRG